MKRLVLFLLAALFSLTKIHAVPAYPYPHTVSQPDGTQLTIVMQGDEFYNFIVTEDGYTVSLNADGGYTYMTRQNGTLVPSNVLAHDAAARTASERDFVASLTKRMTDRQAISASKVKRAARDNDPQRVKKIDYDNFHGLVILVSYSDRAFKRSDANDFYDHMFNEKGYTGYTNEDGTPNQYGSKFIGSMRDYFYDNSGGVFDPKFDVVGPVKVDKLSTFPQQTKYVNELFKQAISKVGSSVDFSRYDNDGDGKIDMIYFVVAGCGSNYPGNDSRLLWPHKSYLTGIPKRNGVSFSTYACSTEMTGTEADDILDGIGVMCHEFTHVLGLPDLYDTDYEETGGQSHHPDVWDIMAGGSYNDYSRRPCGYTAFERYALELVSNVKTITAPGHYHLRDVQSTGDGLILRTPVMYEHFFFENRQKERWDKFIPGHGMTAVRVDSTFVAAWTANFVNEDPTHNYYEMLFANGVPEGTSSGDVFPGPSNVTALRNDTRPNLRPWLDHNTNANQFVIINIEENDGVIEFDVVRQADLLMTTETFEPMPATTSTTESGVQGTIAKWDFVRSNVATPTDEDVVISGNKAVAFNRSSALTMSTSTPFEKNISTVTCLISNPTSVDAKFRVYTSGDGKTWSAAEPNDILVPAGHSFTPTWNVNTVNPVQVRIYQSAGSNNAKCYVDDITIIYTEGSANPYDVNKDGFVNVTDVNLIVSEVLLQGNTPNFDVNNDGSVNVTDINLVVSYILNNK